MESSARYEIILYWSDDDEAFIPEVPELPGCAADGRTYAEALGNVERVIREWIEVPKELNRRANYRLIGAGEGVHWPDIDEDISVWGLLRGVPAHRPSS
jgi:predicted RNase H-like HicB family nuclease